MFCFTERARNVPYHPQRSWSINSTRDEISGYLLTVVGGWRRRETFTIPSRGNAVRRRFTGRKDRTPKYFLSASAQRASNSRVLAVAIAASFREMRARGTLADLPKKSCSITITNNVTRSFDLQLAARIQLIIAFD